MNHALINLLNLYNIKLVNLDFDDNLTKTEILSHIAALLVFQKAYPDVEFPAIETWVKYLTGKRIKFHRESIGKMFKEHNIDVDFPIGFDESRDIAQEASFKDLKALPGAISFIENLDKAGLPKTIVSNSRKIPLMQKIEATNISPLFNEGDIYHPEGIDYDGKAWQFARSFAIDNNINEDELKNTKIGMLLMAAYINNVDITETCLFDDTIGGIKAIERIGGKGFAFIGAKPEAEREVLRQQMLEIIPAQRIIDSYIDFNDPYYIHSLS